MVILLEPNKKILQAAGEQNTILSNIRLINYVVKTNIDQGIVLFNSVTLEMLLFSSDSEIEANIEHLYKNWFFVPNDFCEYTWYNNILKNVHNTGTIESLNHYTIYTTTDCDARCFYCFEKGIKAVDMTEKTANDLADFIVKEANGKVKIKWFGGEPLFNSSVIDVICKKLQTSNVEYASTMTTNGYLFDKQLVKKAKELWQLKKVQITLDGDEPVYNKIKNYIYKDENSFKRVINNIDLLLKNEINVKVRLNVGKYNIESIIALIDKLKVKYSNNPYFTIYSTLVGDSNKEYSLTELKEMNSLLHRTISYLDSSSLSVKRKIIDNKFRLTNCVADDINGCVVNPDGGLGKCASLAYDSLFGSIYTPREKWDYKNISSWAKKAPEIQNCKECCLFPLCGRRLKNCPSDKELPDYELECKNLINNYISSIKSSAMRNLYK